MSPSLVVIQPAMASGVVQMIVSNITTQTQSFTTTWNVVGQVGEHTLYEFYCLSPTSFKSDDCLIGQRFIDVRRLDFQIETESDTTFWQGEIIPIKTLVANLTLSETLVLTSTTYIGFQNDVFFPDDKFSPLLDVEVITLPPGEQIERDYLYDSTYLKGGQLPLIFRLDEILDGDIHP